MLSSVRPPAGSPANPFSRAQAEDKLRGEKRAAAYPDTPTMIEAGFPNVLVTGWAGLLAPAGTPQAFIQKVQRDTARHLLSPELRERLIAMGAEPVGGTSEAFGAFLRAETDKWSRVVRAAGLYQSQ